MKKITITITLVLFSIVLLTTSLKAQTNQHDIVGKVSKVNDVYHYSFEGIVPGDVGTVKYQGNILKIEAVNYLDMSFISFTTTQLVSVTAYAESFTIFEDHEYISIKFLIIDWKYDESRNASSYLPIVNR